jgi:hypothetical protein
MQSPRCLWNRTTSIRKQTLNLPKSKLYHVLSMSILGFNTGLVVSRKVKNSVITSYTMVLWLHSKLYLYYQFSL